MSQSLSARQQLVLQCVIDAHTEGKKPSAKSIGFRMRQKGHAVTDNQCVRDLGVIIYAEGTGVISAKYGNTPTVYLYEPAIAAAKVGV